MLKTNNKLNMVIDLQNILYKGQLTPMEMAEALYPDNKFPLVALKRVLSGASQLDAKQVKMLSVLTRTPIEVLYGQTEWSMVNNREDNLLTLSRGKYRAELDLFTFVTKIYDMDKLVHEDSIVNRKSIKLSEYLDFLTSTINNITDEN